MCGYANQDLWFPVASDLEDLRSSAKLVVTGSLGGELVPTTTAPNSYTRSELTVDQVYKGQGLKPGDIIKICPAHVKTAEQLGVTVSPTRILAFLLGRDNGLGEYQDETVWVTIPVYGIVPASSSGGFDISSSIDPSNPPPQSIILDEEIQRIFGE